MTTAKKKLLDIKRERLEVEEKQLLGCTTGLDSSAVVGINTTRELADNMASRTAIDLTDLLEDKLAAV